MIMIDSMQKEILKSNLKKYVEMITQADKRSGRNMYKCPLCGSGHESGRGHNGAFSITNDGKAWRCFACNKGGDIFTLINLYEGISDFKLQVQRAAEISGERYFFEKQKNKIERKKKSFFYSSISSEKYKQYIEACQKDVGGTDYFKSRGFSNEIVKRFGLGYDKKENVVVIPYDRNGSYYITRSTLGKTFRKPVSEGGRVEPVYNKDALYSGKICFVCESPIDAISLIVAGEGLCDAVALGGVGFQKLIDQISEKKPTSMLVLSFDNDDAGFKAMNKASEELKKLEVPFVVAVYSFVDYPEDRRKDANDLFVSNLDQLKKDIEFNVNEVKRLVNSEKEDRLKRHKANSAYERLKEFSSGNLKGFFISTGFSELDNEFDGGFYPGLYIIGAISSLGKTTFLLQIADQIAERGKDILYFSLEMSARELLSKSVSRNTFMLCKGEKKNAKTARGITTTSRYQGYSNVEKSLIKESIKKYSMYAEHLYFYEGIGSIGVDEIRKQVVEHIDLTGEVPLVFIDYLQILSPYDMRASDKQNTDKAVLELKRLSRDFDTPVVGISSFNRDSYSMAVNMSAFKESGAIEYGSDVLIALQPQGMKPGVTAVEQRENNKLVKDCKASDERKLEAVILKNRNGRTGGKVKFIYYSLFNCFSQDFSSDFEEVEGVENPFTYSEDSGIRL